MTEAVAAELLPGDPGAVRRTAWSMTVYGDLLIDAAEGLKRIDTADGWSGAAADAFRAVYDRKPRDWFVAGDSFHAAAGAPPPPVSCWAPGSSPSPQWASWPAPASP